MSDKEETLNLIQNLSSELEGSINQHQDEASSIYAKYHTAFMSGQSSSLSTEGTALARFMLASSFLAAWHHLSGDKDSRNKTTNSFCSLAISLNGKPLKDTMSMFLYYEGLWKKALRSESPKFKEGWPWISFIGLLYPVLAMTHVARIEESSATDIIGYGFANLGYLLFASALISGSFKALNLQKRTSTFVIAAICWCIGYYLSN